MATKLVPAGVWNHSGSHIEAIARVFPMFPLTVEGLGEAVQHLTKGRTVKGAASRRPCPFCR